VRGTAPRVPSASGSGDQAGWTRTELASSAAGEPPAAAAEPAGVAVSFGWLKVAGIFRKPQWLGGQMITKARPITALSGIAPPPGSPV
jgi:hypothetical protein